MRAVRLSLAALLALALGACAAEEKPKTDTATSASATPAAAPSGAATTPATPAAPADSVTSASAMRLEVDLAKRQLTVYRGNQVAETHGVAVGSKEWPTQTGEWTVKQVVFNPEWIPPDESWAEEREPRKPGDPKNPLGMAQLVYDPPRTVHGTNVPSSIGQAVSHGSIRMRNEEILKLARVLMEAGGATKDEAWFAATQKDRKTKQIVDLPRPIPIKVF